jgi:glycosyltransferase involved in cell wall biosynthesis
MVAEFRPDFIHVNTEGPIGMSGLLAARSLGLRFTTSFRSKFPEYLNVRYRVPVAWTYGFLRWFHNSGAACLVPTESLRRELDGRGFRNLRLWTRGVDSQLFAPREPVDLGLPRPIFLYVGRIAVEKNIEAFLSLDLPGSKLVVGDGPQRAELQARFPAAHFLGAKFGEELAGIFASADVSVFPSRTDTFGNVILESLACGTPVAAFPVMGPRDILTNPGVGALDEDLQAAAIRALGLSREACRAHALTYSWERSVGQFMSGLRVANGVELPEASAG